MASVSFLQEKKAKELQGNIRVLGGTRKATMHPYLLSDPRMPPSGTIVSIIGPMFSGKTTELIRLHDRYRIARKSCVLVKYAGDTRYDAQLVTTHQQEKARGVTVVASRLQDHRDVLYDEEVEVVAIDEGQFFVDLSQTCEELSACGKTVLVAALNADFRRKPFDEVSLLIAVSHDIRLLSAVCMRCGADASCTFRSTHEKQVEVIGGSDTYQALCSTCYNVMSIVKKHEISSRPCRHG